MRWRWPWRSACRWGAMTRWCLCPCTPAGSARAGGNQAEILCRALSPRLGLPVLNLLTRVRETREQTSLARGDRLRNVQGAFSLAGEARGLRLLIVDDVRTTGATARACAQALSQGGARKLGILTATAAVQEEGKHGINA